MAQIILKERTANVVSYTFLQEMLINIKARHLLTLRTAFSQNSYHWLLSSCEYCKVSKNGRFYRTPSETVV